MGIIKVEVRDRHLNRFPTEEEFLKPFLNGFDITYGQQETAFSTTLAVYILNPEPFLKEGFGLNSEIMLVYTPFETTEPRIIQAAEAILNKVPFKKRVDNLNYILVSDNPSIKDWLDGFYLHNQESRIIIPFSKDELLNNKHDSWFVRNKLSEYFFGRDLFGYTLPLKEDTYFFGRQGIIASYIDAIKRSENRGIFGLRKTGKTSLLFKIDRIVRSEKIGLVFFYDCKSPSLRKLRWNELLGEICINIAKRLNVSIKKKFDEINIIKTFRHVLETASIRQIKIILIFDEVEYISFKSLTDHHWHSDFIDFWQTIWAAQSVHRNLSFIIAGVNPSVVEIDKVEGIQNPLFGIVQYNYLKGFSDDELRTMVRLLGRRMGLNFEFDAISYIYHWYGGHPMLTRLACSWINKQLQIENKKRPVGINRQYMTDEEANRDSDLGFYCQHVVSELKDFYPVEYEMLELLASKQIADFVELSYQQEYIKHLESYGLLKYNENNTPEIAIPVVGRYVGLELARKEKRQTIFKLIAKDKRSSWIEQKKEAIIRDFRMLEKLIQNNSLPSLFGPNSFPEADEFFKLKVVETSSDFLSFINICNRCFVESVEVYGKSIGKNDYFWNEVKDIYKGLFYALDRIKTYRNNVDHLQLKNATNSKLLRFLNDDLDNQPSYQVQDFYFLLQQRTLDGLLSGIHIEYNLLN